MLKGLFKIIFFLVIVLLIGSVFLSSDYKVERSALIQARKEEIFHKINSLKEWPSWTAWNKERFPDMAMLFEGPEAGEGARYTWNGATSGEGTIEITKSDPEKGIWYQLTFSDFEPSHASIQLSEEESQVKVVWQHQGNLGKNPFNKYFGLAMDKMIGADFETGLANLKKQLEQK